MKKCINSKGCRKAQRRPIPQVFKLQVNEHSVCVEAGGEFYLLISELLAALVRSFEVRLYADPHPGIKEGKYLLPSNGWCFNVRSISSGRSCLVT